MLLVSHLVRSERTLDWLSMPHNGGVALFLRHRSDETPYATAHLTRVEAESLARYLLEAAEKAHVHQLPAA